MGEKGGELTTSSCVHKDEEIEHNFANPIYDVGEKGGELTTSSSIHNDEEIEHNFANPIYDLGEEEGHSVNDTTCGRSGYSEVRLSLVEDKEKEDRKNSDHEAEL